jgi:hypothetical protein
MGRRARHQWLMPVILVTERLRSGGLQFKASQAKKISQDPIQSIVGHSGTHLGSQATQKAKIEKTEVSGHPRIKRFGDPISMEKAECDHAFLSLQQWWEAGRSGSRPACAKSEILTPK